MARAVTRGAKRRRLNPRYARIVKNRVSGRGTGSSPPPYSVGIRTRQKFRYTMTNGAYTSTTPLQVKRSQLTASMVINTSGGTGNNALFTNTKLVSVEMWSAGTTNASDASIGFEWTGPYSDGKQVSCGSTFAQKAAHLFMKTPHDILDADWSGGATGSDILFQCWSSGGGGSGVTYIETTLDCVISPLSSTLGGNASYTSTNAGTAGQMYYTPLDGTTNNVPPCGAIKDIV